MKRFLCIIFAFVLLMLCVLPISAQVDLSRAEDDAYISDSVYLPYRLLLPEVYDDRYTFPLVVFFHGAGERGSDNNRQLESVVQFMADQMPKTIILAAQCDASAQWVNTPWEAGCYSTDEISESDYMAAVIELIGELDKTYNIDNDRIYAVGYSMGGYGVWDAMVRHNELFAAGVAICGAGDPSKAALLKDTPMFVFHGAQDDTVPVEGSIQMVEAIKAAGGTKVEYTQYGAEGHGIWNMAIRSGVLGKMQKCRLSQRITPEPEAPEAPALDPVLLLGIGGGVLAAALAVVLIVLFRKKK